MYQVLQMCSVFSLSFPIDIDKRDSYGKTALHCAVSAGQVNTVRYLLHNHANPNVKDHREEAPLHAAVRTGNVELVEVTDSWIIRSVKLCQGHLFRSQREFNPMNFAMLFVGNLNDTPVSCLCFETAPVNMSLVPIDFFHLSFQLLANVYIILWLSVLFLLNQIWRPILVLYMIQSWSGTVQLSRAKL